MSKVMTMEKPKVKKPVPQWEEITPEYASKLLQKNTKNRNLNRKLVEYYKRQIHNGLWEDNGETIKIGKDGSLLDGQHRLTAISEGKLAIELLVVRDVNPEAIATIDTGRPRSPADHLKIYGFGNDPNILAAGARVAMSFDKNGRFSVSSARVAPTEVIDWVESNKGILYSLKRVPQSIGVLLPRSIAVGLHYVFSLIDSTKAELFFDYLAQGTRLEEGSPILVLRSRLITMSSKGGTTADKRKTVSYVVNAFKAFLEGRKVSTLVFNPEFDIVLEALPDNMRKSFWSWRGEAPEGIVEIK